jgi:TolB-like protein/tetratricopeptide (TPR) repeat protein
VELQDQLQESLGTEYALERELGGGGMARVFVARKTLAPDFAGTISVERFRREIRLAASLQQANIVPVHTAGEVGGIPYYTMPYVDGDSLRNHLVDRGAMAPQQVISVLRDVARALAFAHERGVIHRDIKPENILLSGSTAVVTDFGIAKAIEASRTAQGTAALTQLGMALGTPAYMSPEQAAGDPDLDHRADIYALGVLAYELLVGAPPFTDANVVALIAAHITRVPPNLGDRCPAAPRDLATLIMRCLAKDPAARPQSAREILESLERSSVPSEGNATSTLVKPSIAVLPFANLSPDPADEYFADGLTDEIITDLAAIRALHVIARASMMRFKGSGKDPAVVARELNVRYALDGSVRRAGSSLRLTARLVDTKDDSIVWSGKLGGSVDDVFEIQERVSRTIVDALRLTLTPSEERQIAERPIGDLKAYECYLQARQSMWIFTVASLDRAKQLVNDAQALVGVNARLTAALGLVHLNYVQTGQVDPRSHVEAANACVAQLAAIEPDSFHLHFLRGWLQWGRGEIREAIASLSRAHELEPSNSDALALLAYAYLLAGQDARAREAAELGVRLDPLTPLFQCMPGFCHLFAGRPSAAIVHYRRFYEMDPANPAAHLFFAWALSENSENDEALRVAKGLALGFPGTVFGQLGRAFAHSLDGEPEAGLALMTNDVRSLSPNSETFARLIAALLARMGDADGAIDALEDAVRLGNSHYPYLSSGSITLTRLRGHPRFEALLDVVRERWQHMR